MLTRSKAARVEAFINAPPSPLSDPPSDEEFEVQEQINNDRLAQEQQQHPDQTTSDDVDMANDADAIPRTPRKTYRVRDIESELSLTRGQGDQLLSLINDEMKKADILGKINFHPKTKAQHEGTLRQVIDAAKRNLTFLGEKGVAEEKLDELLMLRAHICNANEKHNEFMVSSGKVKARASRIDRTAAEAAALNRVHEDDIQQELAAALFNKDDDDHAPIAARTRARSEARVERLTPPMSVRRRRGSTDAPITTRTRARSEARPERATTPTPIRRRQRSNARKSTSRASVVARHLRNLNIGTVTQHEDELVLAPADDNNDIETAAQQPATQPPAIRTHFNTSIFTFHPTAFLIRIVNSTTGAAIRTSSLLPPSPTGIDDLSYQAFIDKVTQQVGFDVRGRISAVVPKALGSTDFVSKDVRVKIEGEEQWKAVLQLWQNGRRRSCEFVVEGGEGGVEG